MDKLKPKGSKDLAAKVSVACPHCAATQLESPFAKSTYCRKCSKHIDLTRLSEPDSAAESRVASFFKKLSNLVSRETSRQIHCFDCNAPQVVSSSAKSSLCPSCGAYIDLRDFKITTSFSRAIQTQGRVVVTGRGELTSTKVICGSALIQGKVHGNIICSGTIRVKYKGRISGGFETRHLLVAKGSDVEFVRPLKTEKAEIQGKVSARVMADAVSISKSGALEGTVYSKAITVEKGGIFHGELVIGKQQLNQPELIPAEDGSPGIQREGMLALGV